MRKHYITTVQEHRQRCKRKNLGEDQGNIAQSHQNVSFCMNLKSDSPKETE